MTKDHRPFLFVNFRKHRETHKIYAIFNQTYNPELDTIQVYSIDQHEDVDKTFILNELIKASRHECDDTLNSLREIYECFIDGLSASIRCVPYHPFQ